MTKKIKNIGKRSQNFNKVYNAFISNQVKVYKDVYEMNGSWSDKPEPLYVYACSKDIFSESFNKYMNSENRQLLSKYKEVLASKTLGSHVYESLLGMLLFHEDYSKKKYPNVGSINAEVTEDIFKDSKDYIFNAVAYNPAFGSYLKRIANQLNGELPHLLLDVIATVKEDVSLMLNKFSDNKENLKESVFHSEKEEAVRLFVADNFAFILNKDIPIGLKKEIVNTILDKQPAYAIYGVEPAVFFSLGDKDIEKKYIDAFKNKINPNDLEQSKHKFKIKNNYSYNHSYDYLMIPSLSLDNIKAYLRDEKYKDVLPKALANYIVCLKDMNISEEIFEDFLEKFKNIKGKAYNDIAENIYLRVGNCLNEYEDFVAQSKVWKKAIKDIKGVPTYLKEMVFVKGEDSIKNLDVAAMSNKDFEKYISKSVEGIEAFLNSLTKELGFSEIKCDCIQKFLNSASSEEVSKVFDLLNSSNKVETFPYLVSLSFERAGLESDKSLSIVKKVNENKNLYTELNKKQRVLVSQMVMNNFLDENISLSISVKKGM